MTGPSQVPGPTVAPSAWASVRLIQGASKANQWQIDSSTTRAQLTVGADKACDWPVAAGGVAAVHFELFWDGRRLWIADTHEAGGVTVDGGRLASWQPITGRARIEFGSAVMVAECSVPAVSVEGRSPQPSPPLSMDLEPTRRPGQGSAMDGDDERTTLHVRHDSHPGGKGHDENVPLHAAPTTISEMPEGAAPFGGPYGGPPPMPPGSGMSPPSVLQARKPVMAVPTIIAEPGRGLPAGMLQMPSPPARGPMGGMGMATPDPGARPGMPPGMGMGMGMGMPTPDPAAAMRPGMMMGPPMPHPMAQPMATPTGRPPWMDRLGLPKTSVPPRTWGLVILTVAALMIVMFMGGNDKEAPRRRVVKKPATTAQAGSQTATPAPTPATPQPAGAGETQPAAPGPGETAGKTGEGKTAETAGKTGEGKTAETAGKTGEGKTAETAGKTGEGKTAETAGKTGELGKTVATAGKTGEGKTAKSGEGKTAETAGKTGETTTGDVSGSGASATPAQGADLLLAGRQREALAVYDELARRFPEQREYAAIVKILKRRLADRCKDKQQPGDSPCPPVQ